MASSSLEEIIKESGLEVREGKVVLPGWVKRLKIDVGLSSNAPQSAVWLETDPDLAVLGFEPVTRNIDAIRSGASPWPTKVDRSLVGSRLFILPLALGLVDGLTTSAINITAEDTGRSSLLEPREFEVIDSEIVNVAPLWSVLKYFDFQQVPYIEHLKTDCQGTDLDVLVSAGEYIRRILVITAEAENHQYWNSKNSKQQIKKFLASRDFVSYKKVRSDLKHLGSSFVVHDPTFVNKQLLHDHRPRGLRIYQQG